MPNNKFTLLHTPVGLTTPVTDISDAVMINESEGIRSTADTFSFTVQAKDKYKRQAADGGCFFNDGDRIRLYLSSGDTTPQLVIDGIIKEIDYSGSLDRDTYTIQGQNILEILLNAPVPAAYSKTGSFNTSAKAIQNIVTQASGLNKNAKYTFVTNISATLKSAGGYIDDTTNTLITFPSDYGRTHMPAFQIIEELSTWKWTGLDIALGTYIYYLDSSNNFHWEPISNTVSGGINIGDYLDIRINKTIFDVINYMIINCGKDFNGNTITTFAFRPTYLVKGIRGKYFVNEQLANNRKAVPYASNKPWGNADKSDGNTDNNTFRSRVQADGKAWGESVLQVFGAPRFQATITMKGTTAFAKGNLYTLNIPGVFRGINDDVIDSLDLRLRQVSHRINSSGWTTQLQLQQDEISITGAGTV